MLDVDGGQHCDAGVEDVLDVLPALGVPRAGCVGVGELIDQDDRRTAGQHRVHVELGQRDPAMGQLTAGQDLQPAELGANLCAAVGLDHSDDHIGAAVGPVVGLVEHGVGLPHPPGAASR